VYYFPTPIMWHHPVTMWHLWLSCTDTRTSIRLYMCIAFWPLSQKGMHPNVVSGSTHPISLSNPYRCQCVVLRIVLQRSMISCLPTFYFWVTRIGTVVTSPKKWASRLEGQLPTSKPRWIFMMTMWQSCSCWNCPGRTASHPGRCAWLTYEGFWWPCGGLECSSNGLL